MKIISERTVELEPGEASIKDKFDNMLSGGWKIHEAIARIKELHPGMDPGFVRWMTGGPVMPPEPNYSTYPYEWAVEYLKDARDSDAVDRDTSDEIIEREARKLELLIFQIASSFVDNEFEERP